MEVKTILDLELSLNTQANHALMVARQTVRKVIIACYREIKDEGSPLTGGGIDEYNKTLMEADLADNANDVRESQGHDRVATVGQLCALADAAHDELADIVKDMLESADRDEDGNIVNMKGIAFYMRDLKLTIDEQFKREWLEPNAKSLSQTTIMKEMQVLQVAYGSSATWDFTVEHLLARRRAIGERYKARFEEIVEKINAYALANRQLHMASFDSIYRGLLTREQNGRDVRAMISMIENNVRAFQKTAFKRKFGAEWAASIVVEKQADLPALKELAAELVDTTNEAKEPVEQK
jgi:hypothetical protein